MSGIAKSEIDLAGKALLIFDDGLRALGGHWYEYDRATAQLHLERGAKVTLICNKAFADGEALRAMGIEVLPLVERSVWTQPARAAGKIGEQIALLKQAWYFARLLANHLAKRRYDLVFVPNAMIFDALAWRILLAKEVGKNVGRIALLFRFSIPGVDSDPGTPIARKFLVWRGIFRSLQASARRGRVEYLTDSSRLTQEYRRVARVSPAVIPSPRALPLLDRRQDESADLTFALAGFATWGRGIDRFEQAIETLLAKRSGRIRFVIQRYAQVVGPDGHVIEPAPRLKTSQQVEFISEMLPSAEYATLFARIDCMILPYRRALYHSQISGIAVEAACAGIPMIYTADTWLSDFVGEQGAGIAVADGDAEGLAQAILAMAADYPTYKAKAVERSAIARTRNSPEAFARVLWGAGPNARDAGSET